MSESSRTEAYREFLEEEGYRPKVDEDGDLIFKAEGLTFVLFAADEDETFFKLALPNIWSVEDAAEKAKAVRAAHDITRDVKVAKVYVTKRRSVWCSVEAFFGEQDDFRPVFTRSISAMRTAVREFAEKMGFGRSREIEDERRTFLLRAPEDSATSEPPEDEAADEEDDEFGAIDDDDADAEDETDLT